MTAGSKTARPPLEPIYLFSIVRAVQVSSAALTAQVEYLRDSRVSLKKEQILELTKFEFRMMGSSINSVSPFGGPTRVPRALIEIDSTNPFGRSFFVWLVRRIHEEQGHCSERHLQRTISRLVKCQGLGAIIREDLSDCHSREGRTISLGLWTHRPGSHGRSSISIISQLQKISSPRSVTFWWPYVISLNLCWLPGFGPRRLARLTASSASGFVYSVRLCDSDRIEGKNSVIWRAPRSIRPYGDSSRRTVHPVMAWSNGS